MMKLLERLTNNLSVMQLVRYGIVGVATNLIGYGVYLIVTYLGGTPKLTMSLLYGVGAVSGFWGHRKLTFAHGGSLPGTWVRYVLAHGVGYLINLSLLALLVDRLGWEHQWVQAMAIFIVAGYLFFVFKYFVFSKPASLV